MKKKHVLIDLITNALNYLLVNKIIKTSKNTQKKKKQNKKTTKNSPKTCNSCFIHTNIAIEYPKRAILPSPP